ncbi:hypothetical protein L208DRAFT_137177 [Tricholoma matsutake]|nr:hypothetical protein L208DRAFT_137177 [Tricholoma matsutake 945]
MQLTASLFPLLLQRHLTISSALRHLFTPPSTSIKMNCCLRSHAHPATDHARTVEGWRTSVRSENGWTRFLINRKALLTLARRALLSRLFGYCPLPPRSAFRIIGTGQLFLLLLSMPVDERKLDPRNLFQYLQGGVGTRDGNPEPRSCRPASSSTNTMLTTSCEVGGKASVSSFWYAEQSFSRWVGGKKKTLLDDSLVDNMIALVQKILRSELTT